MKLYVWGPAPNPRRVKMFLAEKGIEVPMEDVGEGGVLQGQFLEKGSHRMVPALELDDGTFIGEAIAVCRYFEVLQPEPPLLGRDAREAGLVTMWEHKCEMEGIHAAAEILRNKARTFVDRGLAGYSVPIPQIGELVDRGRARMGAFYGKLDERLGQAPYLAGENFTMADITALCAVDFARTCRVEVPSELTHLARWHALVSQRPSAAV